MPTNSSAPPPSSPTPPTPSSPPSAPPSHEPQVAPPVQPPSQPLPSPPPPSPPPPSPSPPPFSPPIKQPPPSPPPPSPSPPPFSPPIIQPPPPRTPPPPPPSPPSPTQNGRSPPWNPPQTRTPPVPPPPALTGSNEISELVVGISVGAALVVIVLLVLLAVVALRRRRHREHDYNLQPNNPIAIKVEPTIIATSASDGSSSTPPPTNTSSSGPVLPKMPPPITPVNVPHSPLTYAELMIATGDFSEDNLLGEGGFGLVHKGVLPNGKEIAVKQLKAGSEQGEKEFRAEVEIIGRVHHRNLVSLVGYCVHEKKRLLVYEFVPNDTLQFHLHDVSQPTIDWSARVRIAEGAARGIAYLHEDCQPKIIHRDIKAANILLDDRFEAKVADFGLAKFFPDDYTHVTTRVLGTIGYLAPEYSSSGKLTEKSDVYSYGVVLLELITGRLPSHAADSSSSSPNESEISLVEWAKPQLVQALEDGYYERLADCKIHGNYDINQMARMVACAAACVRRHPKQRPSMRQIVRVLEGSTSQFDLLHPNMSPIQAAHLGSGSDTSPGSSDKPKVRSARTRRFNKTHASKEANEHGSTS